MALSLRFLNDDGVSVAPYSFNYREYGLLR